MSADLQPTPLFPAAPDLRARGRQLTPVAPIPAAVSSAPHRLNTVLGWLLIVVLALAPIPLASNRPAFWTIWATVIGLLSVGYGIALILLRAPARLPMLRFWPEVAGFGLLIGWLLVQMLPIGRWLPGALTAPGIGTSAKSVSLDPGSTLMTLLNFATYGLLFALVAQVGANRRRARTMLFALFLVIAAFAVYGIVSLVQLGDTLLGFEKLHYKGVATGTFVNRNSFATFLASGLAVGVPLLLDNPGRHRSLGQLRTWIRPALVLLGMLFIAATLLATDSRMGAAAGLAGLVVALTLSFLKGEKTRARWWLLAILVGAAAIVAVLYGAGTLERSLLTDDDAGRGELYRQVWPTILERPFTGYGGGSFATVFPAIQQAPLGANDTVWDKAHSTYLSLWFEMGVIAGSLPLLIIATLLFRAVRGLGDQSSRSVSIAAIAVTVVFALHSAVDFSAEIMANAFLFTAVLALGASGAALAGER